jgi:ABC-type oligopeptide transport system substrate-binding subunit
LKRLAGWNVEFHEDADVNTTRRGFLHCAGLYVLVRGGLLSPSPVWAAGEDWRQGVFPFGTLKYPLGFAVFDYVDASAPTGGTVRQSAFGTYDNFNAVVAGLKGNLADGIELIYDTLLLPSLDEASSA